MCSSCLVFCLFFTRGLTLPWLLTQPKENISNQWDRTRHSVPVGCHTYESVQTAAGSNGSLECCGHVGRLGVVLVGSLSIDDELAPVLGAPEDIENPENDEGLQEALQFAMTEYNNASNDIYSSRVVRIISANRQLVSGVKYVMEVEIGRTTCLKTATDLQSCALHEEPDMAKRTTCNFVVYTIPWLNQIKLLESSCQ